MNNVRKVLLYLFFVVCSVFAFCNEISAEVLTHITSVSELTPSSSKNSHKDLWKSSRLELDYRSQVLLNNSKLVSNMSIYPRIKKISSTNNYILLYQNSQIGSKVRYMLSEDASLKNWESAKVLFDVSNMSFSEKGFSNKTVEKYYTTGDAAVLEDGKTILAVASFRVGTIGANKYSLLANKKYSLVNKYSGIDLKYSTDGGKTWSAAQRVYTGYNWEPILNVIDNNTVQVYFSQVAVSMEHTGIEHSSGIGKFTLTRSGNGWKSSSSKIEGRNFTSTKTVFKFPIKDMDTKKSFKVLGIDNKMHTRMTAQMPAVLSLNNGGMVIAAESMYVKYSTKSKKKVDRCMISFAFSNNHEFSNIGVGQSGPKNMKLYQIYGCGPYVGQFKSGEGVLVYNYNGVYKLRLASSDFRIISGYVYTPLPKAKSGYWGTVEIDHKTNSLISAMHGTNSNQGSNMYISRSYLNHAIKISNQSITLDGNSSEWKTQESLFIGGNSQAQAVYRFAKDSQNLYISSEVLDKKIIPVRDTQLIYIGKSSDEYYKIHFSTRGLLKTVMVKNGVESEVSGVQIEVQTLSTDQIEKNGYVSEVAIPLSLLKNDLKGLRINPILYNSDDDNISAKSDIINYTNTQKFNTWIPFIL